MAYGAYGLVEVRGRANGVRVLDQMCKAAAVTFETENTRNGGHDTIVVGGDISACKAAVESVVENPPCPILSSWVITGPSEEFVKVMDEWKAGLR
ncbi:MAG: BMC domain-containing protein [Bilifractor sp.]